jgi:lipopolysaccharide/colanic/teichoic acid biosynthesis glycosyltransferase
MGYETVKRGMDLVLALMLSVVFAPIAFLVALAIKLESPNGTILLKDAPPRVGKDGRLFHTLKFRSMIPNAYQLLRTDPKFREAYEEQQKGGNYKIANDPRITRVGRFIRKYSLDEVPQFINVLRGDMSVIGPRPYYAEELEKQQLKYPNTKDLVKEALSVRPGITGLWQVSGRSEVNFDKRIELDAYYARHKNLWYDFQILFKTPLVMLSGRGAS